MVPLKLPKNSTMIIVGLSGLIISTLVYLFVKPKTFIYDQSSKEYKVVCHCIGKVEQKNEKREKCRGVVFKCDKIDK